MNSSAPVKIIDVCLIYFCYVHFYGVFYRNFSSSFVFTEFPTDNQ